MAYNYKLHPAAQVDYISSTSWYLARSTLAAQGFVNTVDNSLSIICSEPRRYPNTYKNYREFKIRKYPFTIVYTIEESTEFIIIVAIYHQSRQPENKFR